MGESAVGDLSAEGLVEALADAGEFDAGVEVLDGLRMRDPDLPGIVRLQARLFSMGRVSPERRRAVLEGLRTRGIDALARQGAWMESAVAYRVLATAFPDEPAWEEKLQRILAVAAPMPNPDGDPRRTAIDGLMARGATAEAFESLRELLREDVRDTDIARRLEVLRGMLYDPSHTRPYRAMAPEDAARLLGTAPGETSERAVSVPSPAVVATHEARMARVQDAIRAGDVPAALREVLVLTQGGPVNPRWIRLRDALERLAAPAVTAEPEDSPTAAITQKLSPVARVDTWLRQGRLREARDQAREFLSGASSTEVAGELSQRLADLDVVLDGTLPTPAPPRPSWEAEGPTDPAGATSAEIVRETDVADMGTGTPGRETDEPTSPMKPVTRPSSPPPGGDVQVKRRKIVRLE